MPAAATDDHSSAVSSSHSHPATATDDHISAVSSSHSHRSTLRRSNCFIFDRGQDEGAGVATKVEDPYMSW